MNKPAGALPDLPEQAAGQYQRPDRDRCRAGLQAVCENFVRNRIALLKFLVNEKPFMLLPGSVDIQAGSAAVRPKLPALLSS